MSSEVYLVVLDDAVMNRPSEICDLVGFPKPMEVYGTEVTVDWHEKWNALADHARSVGKQCQSLDGNDEFDDALDWCMTTKDSAIVFCDYDLPITITEHHVDRVGEVAWKVFDVETASEAAMHFNDSAQGLLLAAALATNREADIDLWLATTDGVNVDSHKAALKRYERRGFNIDKAYPFLYGRTAKKPAETIAHIRRVFEKKNSGRPWLLDNRRWP